MIQIAVAVALDFISKLHKGLCFIAFSQPREHKNKSIFKQEILYICVKIIFFKFNLIKQNSFFNFLFFPF